jgi:hypothetical protein
MIPALLFLFRSRNMHQLWKAGTRNLITGVSAVASLMLCLQNTYMNLPMVDFRPFKPGSNVRERKELESNAKVEILGWVLSNDSLKQVVKYMEPEPGKITYYKEYPKNQGWKVKDQIQTDWFVEKEGVRMPLTKTKVSDFAIESAENGEVTEDILAEKGYSLMIVAYKLKGQKQMETIIMPDTLWAADTVRISADSFDIRQRVVSVEQKRIEKEVFIPAPEYAARFHGEINPLAEAAAKAGWKVYAITTYADFEWAGDLSKRTAAKYPFYKADDKLLKTIIRANPGVVIWKDGVVLGMYHHRHLPKFEELAGKY